MKSGRSSLSMIAVILGIIVLVMFSAGCQEGQTPASSFAQTPAHTTASTSAASPSNATTASQTSAAVTTSAVPNTQPVSTTPVSTTPVASTSTAQPTTSTPSPSESGSSIIVDHSNWDWYVNQSQQIIDAVAANKYYFTHASVGTNIVDGLKSLNTSDPAQYPLKVKTVGAAVPDSTAEGTFYEYPRGNPGWSEKIKGFETVVKNGWHDPLVDVAMYKFCYIDPTADFAVYRDSMVNLEKLYPNTRFIYWTMPITTGDPEEKLIARTKFNQNLRDWIAAQENKVLFDLADIEAWGPSGEHKTVKVAGTACDLLHKGYTSDGGHLNDAGSARVATALYSLFGLLVK